MRVFRQKYTDRAGKTRESSKWYVELTDHLERIQRIPGFTDKGATWDLAGRLQKLVDARSLNNSPDPDLARWIDLLPSTLRNRLAKIGLIDSRVAANSKRLIEHVDDFEQTLRNRGCTDAHWKTAVPRVRRMVESCGFVFLNDVSLSRIERYLADLKRPTEKRAGNSQQTINHIVAAVKQFFSWLVEDGRTTLNPTSRLRRGNAQVDIRCVRRVLSEDELGRVLDAARKGKKYLGLTGGQRFTLYATAVSTGLRASELSSLTPRSFNFASDSPTVRIEAKHEKARRGDELPMPSDLVELLKPWLATLGPDELLWPGKWAAQKRGSKFIQHDLAIARKQWLGDAQDAAERESRDKSDFLSYHDSEGRQADFHALRHAYLTRLGRAGVSAKTMQKLARHSTVELTLGRYTHADLFDLADAVEKLPRLGIDNSPQTESTVLRATGTDDREAREHIARPTVLKLNDTTSDSGENVLPVCLPEKAAQQCSIVPFGASSELRSEESPIRRRTREHRETSAFPCCSPDQHLDSRPLGEMAERLNAPVLKSIHEKSLFLRFDCDAPNANSLRRFETCRYCRRCR